ncbi:MAG: alpha/beta fold hydrolase [Acidimicrobiia bacterium]
MKGESGFAPVAGGRLYYRPWIRDSRKVVLPGVAHMVGLERPPELNRVVLELLAEVG